MTCSERGQLDFQSGHDVIHAVLADIIKDFHENTKAHLECSMCITFSINGAFSGGTSTDIISQLASLPLYPNRSCDCAPCVTCVTVAASDTAVSKVDARSATTQCQLTSWKQPWSIKTLIKQGWDRVSLISVWGWMESSLQLYVVCNDAAFNCDKQIKSVSV